MNCAIKTATNSSKSDQSTVLHHLQHRSQLIQSFLLPCDFNETFLAYNLQNDYRDLWLCDRSCSSGILFGRTCMAFASNANACVHCVTYSVVQLLLYMICKHLKMHDRNL